MTTERSQTSLRRLRQSAETGPLADLPRELRPACKRLKEMLSRIRHDYLQGYYGVGELVRRDLEQARLQHPMLYGEQIVEQLAEAAGIGSRTLRDCLRLVDRFSQAEFEALIARPGITWGHLTHLLSIKENPEFEAFVVQIEQQGWSADDLARAIIAKYGNRRPGSGRRPKIRRNLRQAVSCLVSVASRFRNVTDKALFGDEFDLPTALVEVPPDDVTEAFRDQAASGAELLEQIAATAAENAKRLRESVARLNKVLAARAASNEAP